MTEIKLYILNNFYTFNLFKLIDIQYYKYVLTLNKLIKLNNLYYFNFIFIYLFLLNINFMD